MNHAQTVLFASDEAHPGMPVARPTGEGHGAMAMNRLQGRRGTVMTPPRRGGVGSMAKVAMAAVMAACIAPAMAQTANTKTTYSYDALDRLTQVTDPSGLSTTYQYDGLSDPTTLTSPDTGVTARTYDAAGNVLTGTDANGTTVTYTYDAQDRRLSASYADSTQNITYTYDEPNSATGCGSSYPIGHLTRIVENAVTTVFCYNAQGYVTQVSQTVNGATDVTSYTRSPGGKLLAITYPSGNQVSYSYDTDGRVSGMTATTATGTSTVVSNISYLPFGPITGYTLGNGQTVTRTYDANYRLTDLTSPAFSVHVARDAMGDITAFGNAPGANPATETYRYDPLYRLTAVTEADGSTLESVTYNPTGDRLSKTGGGLATGSYSYNPNTHQLVATGNAARTVDADGNTTAIAQAGSTYGFGYNARNRLSVAQLNQSTVANYIYNAEGERVAKTANGSTERYTYGPSSELLSEYGSTHRDYVYLGGIPVANLDTQGTTTSIAYVTADQLGAPRAIADGSGNTEWSWAYQGNPWGEQQPASSGYAYNVRFPGQYFDAETGLEYNGARYYDSSIGGFPQADPMGLRGGINPYVYGLNDPLTYIDPTGFAPTQPPMGPFSPEDPGRIPEASDIPSNIPGGPWSSAGAGQRPGAFWGPKPQQGGRTMCQYVPRESEGGPPGSTGYWKTQSPGQSGWSRFDLNGNPITPEQAHPGPAPAPSPSNEEPAPTQPSSPAETPPPVTEPPVVEPPVVEPPIIDPIIP